MLLFAKKQPRAGTRAGEREDSETGAEKQRIQRGYVESFVQLFEQGQGWWQTTWRFSQLYGLQRVSASTSTLLNQTPKPERRSTHGVADDTLKRRAARVVWNLFGPNWRSEVALHRTDSESEGAESDDGN